MTEKKDSLQKALNFWAIILIIWSFYRLNFQFSIWFDEFIAKPLIFILPVYYYIVNIEKKRFFQTLSWKLTIRFSEYLFILGLGSLILFSGLLGKIVRSGSAQNTLDWSYKLFPFLLLVIIAMASAVSEEILSRGFVLRKIYSDSKNIWKSSFFASILFFFLRIPILFTAANISGNLILTVMMTDMIFSMVASLLYLTQKNLTYPILIHAFYNVSILLFI